MKFALGLDMHKDSVAYALINKEGKVQQQGDMKQSQKAILELVEWIPKDKLIIGMESSTYIYPIYDALNDAGYKVKVAHPTKLIRITKSASKNDEKDALHIARQLLRNDFPESYMLSKEMRDKRELVRQHFRLTAEQTRVKNQIHSLIAKHNYRLKSKLGTKKSIEFLKEIQLPNYARITLNLFIDQLLRIKASLRVIKNELHHEALKNEEMQKLIRLDGIFEFSAATFLFELGDWHRFKSVSGLTSYIGLIPTMSSSAGKTYHGRMRYDGNHYIKYAFTRAAEQAIRKENKFKAYFDKLMKKGKKRRTVLCAVANKMIRCCYGVLHNEELANQALLEMG